MRLDSINKVVVVKMIMEKSARWGGIVNRSNRGFRS